MTTNMFGKTFYISSAHHNKRIGCRPDHDGVFTTENRLEWERWQFEADRQEDGCVYYISSSCHDNHFLSARPDGSLFVTSNKDIWQRWRLERSPHHHGVTWFIVSSAHEAQLAGNENGGLYTIVGNDHRGGWETWVLEDRTWADRFHFSSSLMEDASHALLNLKLEGVVVLCSRLEQCDGRVNATEFVQGFVSFFTFNQVRHARDWISHFAIRAWARAENPESGEVMWIDVRMERDNARNVHCRRVGSGHQEANEHFGRMMLAGEFAGPRTMRDLKVHLRNQSGVSYNFLGKNCKHFVYDFFRHHLGEDVGFPAFCEAIEGRAFRA